MEQRRYRGLRDLVEESLLSFGQSLVGELEYVTPVVAYPVSGKPDRVETDLRCGVIVASMKHPIRPPSQWTGWEEYHGVYRQPSSLGLPLRRNRHSRRRTTSLFPYTSLIGLVVDWQF